MVCNLNNSCLKLLTNPNKSHLISLYFFRFTYIISTLFIPLFSTTMTHTGSRTQLDIFNWLATQQLTVALVDSLSEINRLTG